MWSSILLVLVGLTVVLAAPQAYDLPYGADIIYGPVESSFVCIQNGYYADVDNNCQIFHLCYTAMNPNGTQEMLQRSFMCSNQTLFNQLTPQLHLSRR